jgi:hypothetical protein
MFKELKEVTEGQKARVVRLISIKKSLPKTGLVREKRSQEWNELSKILPATNTSTLTSEIGTDSKLSDRRVS